MRLSLEQLDAHGLDLDLPPSAAGDPRRVRVRSAEGMTGVLVREGDLFAIEALQAQTLVLDALSLVFGTLGLAENSATTFRGVRGALRRDGEHLDLEFAAEHASAHLLAVSAGEVFLQGEVHIDGFSLTKRAGQGTLRADRLVVTHFCCRTHGVKLAANRLSARDVAMGWGPAGFRLQAGSLHMDRCESSVAPWQLAGQELALSNVSWQAGSLALGALSIAKAWLNATLELAAAQPGVDVAAKADAGAEADAGATDETRSDAKERSRPEHPVASVAWELLDGLSGELNADLRVDLSVPVVGSRRATHRFRLPVEDGTIDFMELEGGLSRLENALLDFAVRDDGLVLERGIPLLPTRGRGKPLLRWDLADRDLELARQNRVRLAVLPQARKPGTNEVTAEGSENDEVAPGRSAPDANGESRVGLRRLGVDDLGVRLRLTPSQSRAPGPLRSLAFDDLQLEGALEYAPDGVTREGELRATARHVTTSLRALPLGSRRLEIESLEVSTVDRARARVWGLRPREVVLELSTLVCAGLELRPEPPATRPR
jgi:hypothetical protein